VWWSLRSEPPAAESNGALAGAGPLGGGPAV